MTLVEWTDLGIRRAVLALRRAARYPHQAEIVLSQVGY